MHALIRCFTLSASAAGAKREAGCLQAPSLPPSDASWQVHYTGEGRAYYHNALTGTTQWEPPTGYAF